MLDLLVSPRFGLFLAAACVLAVTPGPGLAYVVARTAAGGRREGIASSLGTAVGGLVHVLAAALGLSVVIAQSALAFSLIKYLGAAYLVYMGVRILLGSGRPAAPVAVQRAGWARVFREGILVETLNVKTALFFLAFIPQFVDPSADLAPQFVVLGGVCVALNTTADLVAVAGVARLLRSAAAGRLRARLLSLGSGLTLVGLGLYVALSRQNR